MKKQKDPISGWLNIYKPVGLSAMQVTAKARYLLRAAKAGHTGTLDPLAEGVLPIAFGEATKLIPLVHEGLKTYHFTVQWGVQTSTDDGEGEVIATHPHRPTRLEIQAILADFTGLIAQVPPAFSAVKIDGQRAYAVARAGREVVLQPKEIWIEHLTLLQSPDSDHTDFEVVCGSGTYVRSMARDIAIALGTVGHCTRIIRTQVGVFSAKESILLDSLIEMPYESARALLWQLSQGLDDIPALQLTEEEARRVHSGQVLRLISRQDADRLPVLLDTKQILAMYGERIIAICEVDGVTVKPVRVINT